MKDNAVIFDIDGTLANTTHREHLAQQKKWNEFFSLMSKDTVRQEIVDLVDMFHDEGYDILLVTGRSEDYRKLTVDWLSDQGILRSVMGLYMRPSKDFRKDTEIKLEIYNNHIKDRYNIHSVYEDRSSVVKMWRSLGLTCLQVAEGNF